MRNVLIVFLVVVCVLVGLFVWEKKFENRYVEAIQLGGEWLLNTQDESFLHYEYDLKTGEYSIFQHPLRELGALWSIGKLAKYSGDVRYTDLARKGFLYFEQFLKVDEKNDFIYLNIAPEAIKLGYSDFLILSLLEIDYPQKDYYLEKLANGILYLQNADGSFRTLFYSDETNSNIDYYPGEALLALVSLYEYSPNEKYLAAAEKAFPYYVNYWRNNKNTAFTPWQTRAYAKLYQINKNPELIKFIFEMNDYMVEREEHSSNCDDFKFKDEMAGSAWFEGVTTAYEIARVAGDEKRAGCYRNYAKDAADYLIARQIKNVFNPKTNGGFIGANQELRVDGNQHAIMGLMDALKFGIIK